MTYVGDGERTTLLHAADEHPGFRTGAMTGTVIADADLTGGRYSMYRLDLPAVGGGPDPHFHRTFSESFQVLSGRIEFFDGDEWVVGSPGDHLFVPPGGIHGFRNTSPDPVSMLMLTVPAFPRESYFIELGQMRAAGRDLFPSEWSAFYARHDQYMV